MIIVINNQNLQSMIFHRFIEGFYIFRIVTFYHDFSIFLRKLHGNLLDFRPLWSSSAGESHFGPVHSNKGESLRDPPTFLATREFLLYFVLTGSLLCYFGSRSNTSSLSSLILHELQVSRPLSFLRRNRIFISNRSWWLILISHVMLIHLDW